MKLYLNFIPLQKGGGVQNALSFLLSSGNRFCNGEVVALVRKDSEMEVIARRQGINIHVIDVQKEGRKKAEREMVKIVSEGDACFTFFGSPLYEIKGVSIVGCAYSNLFYPEINFWGYLSLLGQLKKWIWDKIRWRSLLLADFWIFETDVLADRAVNLFNFPTERVGVVKMTPSILVEPSKVKDGLYTKLAEKKGNKRWLLSLCSPHPNKRLHCIPRIAKEMCRKNDDQLQFVFTVDESSPYWQSIKSEFEREGLSQFYLNLGPISPNDVASVVDSSDAMLTFSVLESFSNNFVEAWVMKKPLIVTDADWSRDACKNGALYVNPENAANTARIISDFFSDEESMRDKINEGSKILKTYPSIEEKFSQYMMMIDRGKMMGKCPKALRQKIKRKI